jgi:hypothetical protein
MITDFITGLKVPNIGAEENRQILEKFLVNDKGFSSGDIEVDADMELMIGNETYRSQIDLVVSVAGKRFMAIKCVAGSLGSREREILSASRILDATPLPISVVSDGTTAIVMDTVSGKKRGEGLKAIPSKTEAEVIMQDAGDNPLPTDRLEKEKLIFRAYDRLNVNVQRNIQ